MTDTAKRRILVGSEILILPYLFVFCLLTLGNVANHWNFPGVLIFITQSIVILIELFTAFHVALILSEADSKSVGEEGISFLIFVAVAGLAAIPLSFFWGWVLFALAFALLMYHVVASIAFYLSRPKNEESKEEIVLEQEQTQS